MRRLLGWWSVATAVVVVGCVGLLLVARSEWQDRLSLRCAVKDLEATLLLEANVHPPYRLTVDWGDGSADAAASHVYAAPGRYEVRVTVDDGRGHRLVERCAVAPVAAG